MPGFAFIFIVVPILEIYLLIKAGGAFGIDWTIFAVVVTAVAGAALVRRQGWQLWPMRGPPSVGEMPAFELCEGLVLLVSGALLMTPGFFTDFVGFLCLVPALRRWFIASWLMRFIVTPVAPRGHGPLGLSRANFAAWTIKSALQT